MEAVMIPILYEKNETSFGSNWGLGFISDLLSCTVTEERNGEFILENGIVRMTSDVPDLVPEE